MTRLTKTIIGGFVVGFLLAVVTAPADAHDGDHPLQCDDVTIPEGIACHNPGQYGYPHPGDDRHPVCLGTRDTVGSAAAEPYFYECLPETGVPSGGLAVAALMLIVGGVAILVRGVLDDA